MVENKDDGEIKTFNAIRKPIGYKVFQFIEDMLPERDKKMLKNRESYIQDFNKDIYFRIWADGDIDCLLKMNEGSSFGTIFKIGDYIAKHEKGNCFIISREEFEKNWILPCGHTIEEHKQFQHLSPEEQEILQNECDCEVQE